VSQKVRDRMDAWFPSRHVRDQVYELLALAMEIANRINPEGWYAGYVTESRWGGNRLSVNARHAQAFIAHSAGEVFFPAPPEEVDADGGRCSALGDRPTDGGSRPRTTRTGRVAQRVRQPGDCHKLNAPVARRW
jgi:hypothetical protein